jgi:hypothetical protein
MIVRFYSGCGCYYETNTEDGFTTFDVACVFHRIQRIFVEKNKKKQVING